MKKTLIFLILLFVLTACNEETLTKKELFENDYVSFKGESHVFIKEELNNAIEKLINGTGIIVFAFNPNIKDCPFCDEAFPIMNEVAQDLSIPEIAYVDIYKARTSNSYPYPLLYNYLSNCSNPNVLDEIGEELTGYGKIIVPDVYVVKNGQVLAHHTALLKDDQDRFIKNLDLSQKEEVSNIYREMFSLLVD